MFEKGSYLLFDFFDLMSQTMQKTTLTRKRVNKQQYIEHI